jgi:hypothetical protein
VKRLFLLVLLVPAFALGRAKPGPAPLVPDPFIVDTSLVPMPISCPQTTPRAAFDGTNYLVVWTGTWYGSEDSIIATRVNPSGSVIDPCGIRIGKGTAPSVAFDGNNYLMTWERDSTIHCARVSRAGVVLDTPIAVTNVRGTAPAVAFDGTNYLVAWGGNDLYSARVSPAGAVLDTEGILVSGANGVQEHPSIARDGANCLITWQDMRPGGYSDIYGARVTPSGSVLDPGGIAISTASYSQHYPAVAFDGTNYLVTWQDYRTTDFDIFAGRVTPAGTVLDPEGLPIATNAIYQRYPSVTFGQGFFMVTWERWDSTECSGIWGARIRTSGVPLDTGFLIAPAGEHFAPVISDGSRYFVSWEENGIRATWVDSGGHVQNQSGSPVYAAANDQRQPNATFNGTNFLVVWQDERPGDSADIRGVRLSRSGTQIDPLPFSVSAALKAQSNPVAASNGTDFLVAWSDLRNDPAKVYAARVSQDGEVLDTDGIRVCNASGDQTLPAVANNGTDYLIAWQDGRGADAAIYAARLTADGAVLDPQGLQVCSSTYSQQYPSLSCDGTNYLVVWSDSRAGNDIFGARIDASGHVLDSAGFMISPDTLSKSYPAINYCGDRYFVTWLLAGRHVEGAFVLPTGKVLNVATVWNERAARGPCAAFDGTNVAVAWENGTETDVYAATIDLMGNRLDTFALAATSGKEYGPRLTSGPSGRVLAVYSGWVDTAAVKPWYCRRILGDISAFGDVTAEPPVVQRSPPAVFPNPFHSSISISLDHLTTGPLDHFSFRVFDAQGRLIRTLLVSSLLSPPSSLTWDATDARGLPVPSGIYFITVGSGSTSETRPVTFIRN